MKTPKNWQNVSDVLFAKKKTKKEQDKVRRERQKILKEREKNKK